MDNRKCPGAFYTPRPLCSTNAVSLTDASVRTVFFEDIINYVLNYVLGFRIEVSG